MRQSWRGPTAKWSFGSRRNTSSPIRSAAQPASPTILPAAIRLPTLPTAFSSAFWRTVQLLTMTRSASSSPSARTCPAAASIAATASESRTFIWHP